jgi:hypothetical protein
MEDSEKIIIRDKVSRSNDPVANRSFECLLQGSAIGEEGLIPCILEAHNAGSGDCTVKIADGHRTGEVVTVGERQVMALSQEFISEACKSLFK